MFDVTLKIINFVVEPAKIFPTIFLRNCQRFGLNGTPRENKKTSVISCLI